MGAELRPPEDHEEWCPLFMVDCNCQRLAPVAQGGIPPRAAETYVRKAKTRLPDGAFVERDWTPGERYQLYMRGFRDGAAIKAMRDDHIGLGAYDRGYGDGRHALHDALDTYGKEVGHVPSVLRAVGGSE